MGAGTKLVFGLVLLLAGLYTGSMWRTNLVGLVKGGLPLVLVILGLLIVWIEAEELKERNAPKPESFARRRAKPKP